MIHRGRGWKLHPDEETHRGQKTAQGVAAPLQTSSWGLGWFKHWMDLLGLPLMPQSFTGHLIPDVFMKEWIKNLSQTAGMLWISSPFQHPNLLRNILLESKEKKKKGIEDYKPLNLSFDYKGARTQPDWSSYEALQPSQKTAQSSHYLYCTGAAFWHCFQELASSFSNLFVRHQQPQITAVWTAQ